MRSCFFDRFQPTSPEQKIDRSRVQCKRSLTCYQILCAVVITTNQPTLHINCLYPLPPWPPACYVTCRTAGRAQAVSASVCNRMAGVVVVLLLCFLGCTATALNDRPILGVLSQELSPDIRDEFPDNYTSYIVASYVKFLESSGARVVPVWINQSTEYYEYIVNSVNGLLIPGGAAPFNATDGYATAGWELYKLAEQKNDEGVYFPVWGTCLGFELLAVLSANRTDIRNLCEVQNVPMALVFKPDYRSSRMFKVDPDNARDILVKENVTFNFHHWCITEENLAASNVAEQWRVLSVNTHNNSEFVSSFEHRTYPFYGVQFHPEKNAFEWSIETIPHSADAILVEQFYGNFLISEARKNNNSFSNLKEERAALIYNYQATHTGDKLSFEQIYFFTAEEQVFTVTTTTTTTAARNTTPETITEASVKSAGAISAQSKQSAASVLSSVTPLTMCSAVLLALIIQH